MMHKTIKLKGCKLLDKKSLLVACCVALLAGCSNGGSESSQRGENTLPAIQLDEGDVLSNGNSVIRIPATDDTGIATVSARIVRQGKLEECRAVLDFTLVRDSLLDACLADQPTCSVDFIPTANEVVVYPPPLYAPIGLEYELSFIDRDGSSTNPTKAVFCFDVGANAAPAPAADTYQLIFPGFIQKGGVNYNARCEKADGFDGVLANDDDDEHITNKCLTAELEELPRFASNLETFRQNFQANGGFRYEGLRDAPAAGEDSFTYRVTDGVNPPSEPITVQIIFSGENSAPVAANDAFTVAEDTPSQELDVLANDSDPDALPLTVSSVFNGPTSGVVNVRNGVVIDYIPNANFSGEDRFSYSITDSGGLVANANVVVTVNGVNDAPLAQNDAVTTKENVALEISVLVNDSDPEGNTLSLASVVTPANGTAVVSSGGQILYTPATNFFGVDPFEYTISDGNGGSDTATVVVTVESVNVPPVATGDSLAVEEGSFTTLDVLANDTDGDGDTLMLLEVTRPNNGVAEIVSDTTVKYTPTGNYNGPDTFSYSVGDGLVVSSAQVTVSVGAVNDLPVAVDDAIGTTENNAVVIAVTANDSDPDGDVLTVSVVTQSRNGVVSIEDDKRGVVYTPNPQFSGADSFTYTVTDSNGGNATARVSVQVTDTNGAPVASDDSASTPQDTAVTVSVLANDTDPDGDSLTLSIFSGATNGLAVVQGAAIVYTPAAGFDGSDSFTYQVADADGLTATAVVSITVSDVNASPVAVDDSAGVNENTAVTIAVLSNDSDPDGDPVSLSSVTSPANGTAVVQGNSVRYTPAADFAGVDQFTYQISDGKGGADTGSVAITVSNVNQSPVAVNDSAGANENTAVTIAVLANDSDPDGDPVSLSSVTSPANGTAVVQGDSIRYTPATDFAGTDRFTYEISDGNEGSDTAEVTITVSDVNQPPLAVDDEVSNEQDDAISISVLVNDSDPDGDSVTVQSVTQPANGEATVSANTLRVVYRPTTGFVGTDIFQYTITDGNQAISSATVTVNVIGVNGPPVAVPDSASTLENVPVTIDVTANDTDPNGDAIVLASVTQPANGTTAMSNGSISYTPAPSYSGTDSFTYVINDGTPAQAIGTVTVSVTADPSNTPPVALNDLAVTDEGAAVVINVLANDSDDDGDQLTVTITTAPVNGAATVAGNQVTYLPAAAFSGSDTFEYTVDDGNGGTATASVAITVNSASVPPVANDDVGVTDQDVPAQFAVLTNDTFADVSALTFSITAPPTNGEATIVNNVVNYTPAVGFSGSDSIGYTILDNGGSDSATLSVTVIAVVVTNTLPVAVDDSATTPQDTAIEINVLANDTDADLDVLSVSDTADPENGEAIIVDNQIFYTPGEGYFGSDSIVYTIDDSKGGTATATVSITVTPLEGANQPPVAVDDAVVTTEETTVIVKVLANDSDPDNDTLVVAVESVPANGTLEVRPNRRILYTPIAGFIGTDAFVYSIDDGNGGTATGTVMVTVNSAAA